MTKTIFELMTFGFDTILIYHLSQKFKLIGRDKFNHLINIVLSSSYIASYNSLLNNITR
jgi:hypothetical protein